MAPEEILCSMFAGSDLAHGLTIVSKNVDKRGKAEARHWTVKRAASLEEWKRHLAGHHEILGISPINSKSRCCWGAIDIDTYKSPELHTSLVNRIADTGIKSLVTYSKSGGAHIFVMLNDWIDAETMLQRMQELAAYVGHASAEIFPKQTTIKAQGAETNDYGNWISMPFWGGRNSVYLFKKDGNIVAGTTPDFLATHTEFINDVEDFLSAEFPYSDEIFPDGPPCLNRLFATANQDGSRNVLLANATVYAKQAYPDTWAGFVQKCNARFDTPLPPQEVAAIIKSYGRKEYKYQCRLEPLKSHCNARKCRTCRFGIGHQPILPGNQSLSMINTEPPIWYLDIVLKDGRERRIAMSTEQLQNPVGFQKRCMEVLHEMPPIMKREDWQEVVSELMANVKVVDVPIEMTREGQFLDILSDFFANTARDGCEEDILRGMAWYHEGGYLFRLKDLNNYMMMQRFTQLAPNEILATIKNTLKGERVFRKINEKGLNLWKVIINSDSQINPPPVKSPPPTEPY